MKWIKNKGFCGHIVLWLLNNRIFFFYQPFDIRLDEIGILRQPKLLHYAKPLLTFQNNYDQRIYFDVLPMSIARDPKVLEDEKYIKIKPEDVEAVRQFVIKHYDLLMKHRNQKMTTMELYEILKSERNR